MGIGSFTVAADGRDESRPRDDCRQQEVAVDVTGPSGPFDLVEQGQCPTGLGCVVECDRGEESDDGTPAHTAHLHRGQDAQFCGVTVATGIGETDQLTDSADDFGRHSDRPSFSALLFSRCRSAEDRRQARPEQSRTGMPDRGGTDACRIDSRIGIDILGECSVESEPGPVRANLGRQKTERGAGGPRRKQEHRYAHRLGHSQQLGPAAAVTSQEQHIAEELRLDGACRFHMLDEHFEQGCDRGSPTRCSGELMAQLGSDEGGDLQQ